MRSVSRFGVLAGCLTLGLAVTVATVTADGQRRGRGQARPTQNLQVLPSDWTQAEVLPVMQRFTQGLGVQCTHCHVNADRSSDEKPAKVLARKMLQMTMAINTTYLEGVGEPVAEGESKVTCFTCHRGTLKPLVVPDGGL